jgi:TolB-like protein
MHSLSGTSATKPPFFCRLSAGLIYLFLLIALSACATSRFVAGDQKNSLPLADRRLLQEVHSIAVAPFYHDDNHWRQITQEALSAPKLDVISSAKVDAEARNTGRDLSSIGPDDRAGALVKLGRSLQADAVLNGVVLSKGDRNELIIQLISSGDSRILFWQAADFSFKGARIDPDAQRELISRMLEPLVANAAKRNKALMTPPVHRKALEAPKQAVDEESKPESQPKAEKKQKTDKRHEREQRPPVAPEDISPM